MHLTSSVIENSNPDRSGENPSFFQRRVIAPIVDLLAVGCSPRKLAWSIAFGLVLGINPLLGSTTVVSLVFAIVFRLNLVASQIANHIVYPLQLALFIVFIKMGDALFHTGSLPIGGQTIFREARHHPWATTKLLWTWEWHALIVWAIFAAIAAPVAAAILTPALERLHTRFHKHPVAA